MRFDGVEIEEVRRVMSRDQTDRQAKVFGSSEGRDFVEEERDFQRGHAAGAADQKIEVRFHRFMKMPKPAREEVVRTERILSLTSLFYVYIKDETKQRKIISLRHQLVIFSKTISMQEKDIVK